MVETRTSADPQELDNFIPEALIASAKDARYLESCRELVRQVLVAIMAPMAEATTAELSEQNGFNLEACLISTVIYAIINTWRRTKTIGMEVVGLQHASEWDRWKMFGAILSHGLVSYSVHRLANMFNDDPAQEREMLRGRRRREAYETQRRAMLDFASERNPPKRTKTRISPEDDSPEVPAMSTHVKSFVHRLSHFLSGTYNEPHTIPGQPNTRTEMTPYALAVLLLQLHLAWFCLNGKFPTWMHRLTNSSYRQEQTNRTLINRPVTMRLVAILIFAQALGKSFLSFARPCIWWWVRRLDVRRRYRNPKIDFGFATDFNPDTAKCALCQQIRKYPACPIQCGHVACWKCLHHWVRTRRPECPICRTICQPEDILPLYNYHPGTDYEK